MLPLEYNPKFGREADGYFRWYEARLSGLGFDFLSEIGDVLARIKSNPNHYGLATATIRQGLVKRFPFSIFYRIKPDRIRILSLWHNSRGSSPWKYRR